MNRTELAPYAKKVSQSGFDFVAAGLQVENRRADKNHQQRENNGAAKGTAQLMALR
jgi:hypothetical protein